MPNGTGAVPSHMPVNLHPPILDPTGRKRVYVDPPVIHIGKGSTQLRKLRFTNNTGDKARFWFLIGAALFVAPPRGYKDFTNPFVVDAGDALDLELKPDLGYSYHEFHVYCDVIGNEAEGSSPPGISCP
jgi:hypothetical protein